MHSRFMTIAGAFALSILSMSLASAQEKQDKHVMLDKLQGSWILDSMEIGGEKRQGEELPARFQGMKQTIKDDKMIVSRVDGMQFECRIVVRGEAEPYELDIIQEDREGKKKTLKCIFKIVDQAFVLAEGKDERPTSFETSPDVRTKVSTFTLKP
ncbi:MAG: TIGR03067 domain-containing protein [Planctomycetaceae bacterium]|nr:TIGR03067 domain-containing protein [Planctomycetaceae bacterium]MBN8599847.1 TIGR03067 domain-containing protein [Planctomycetota bacterium]